MIPQDITEGATTGEIRAQARDLLAAVEKARDGFMALANACLVEGANTCGDWQVFCDEVANRIKWELA